MIAKLPPNHIDDTGMVYHADRDKINEVIDAVNKLSDIIHAAPGDDDEDVTVDARSKNQLPKIDTTDGLLSDFSDYLAANKGVLRVGQALTVFTGFRKVWGEDADGELHDLWEWKGKK